MLKKITNFHQTRTGVKISANTKGIELQLIVKLVHLTWNDLKSSMKCNKEYLEIELMITGHGRVSEGLDDRGVGIL